LRLFFAGCCKIRAHSSILGAAHRNTFKKVKGRKRLCSANFAAFPTCSHCSG
jgi:hypothetical protein